MKKESLFGKNTKVKTLFKVVNVWDSSAIYDKSKDQIQEYKADSLTIQGWLRFSGHELDSLLIIPTKKLLGKIAESMLYIEYDRIYFEAIPFGDKVDLYARYNLIIGSRYLGRFNLAEIVK